MSCVLIGDVQAKDQTMKRTICLLLTMLLFGPLVSAREIAGVTIPDTAQLSPDGTTLVLNGAGVRRKFFFKIYVAGLYLPSRQTSSVVNYLARSGSGCTFFTRK